LNKKNKIIFFTGKGGVGKSTVSSLCALNLANSGKDTLLVSLDPAHNLQDIFQKKFSDKTYMLNDKLSIIQIDVEKQIKSYLQNTIDKIERVYQYQSAFSIKNYFKVLKHSPGLEEYALLQAFEQIIKKHSDKYLIFDMPPTALSLRFFGLPANSLIWLKELIKLRNAILEKKEIITKVKFGKKEIETDKVSTQLQTLNKEHLNIQQVFNSETTKINIVLNPDKLSVNEAIRIQSSLNELKILPAHFILNKNTSNTGQATFPFDVLKIPVHNKPLWGVENLQNFITENHISSTLTHCIE